jgi:hypothetical protein
LSLWLIRYYVRPDIVFRIILDPGREVAFGPQLNTPRTPDNAKKYMCESSTLTQAG